MTWLGAALLVLKVAVLRAWVVAPALTVELGPGESVESAVLFDHALRSGWVHTDPVVRRRLVDNLRFAGREGGEEALFGEALALGMDRVDPVVRVRLVGRARDVLGDVGEPSGEVLSAWFADHADVFRRAPVMRVEQRRVDGVLASVPAELVGTSTQLSARMGVGFGEAVGAMQTGEVGEVASSFGLHHVRVVDAGEASLPELDTIRAEVRQHWREAESESVAAERLEALIRRYTVVRP